MVFHKGSTSYKVNIRKLLISLKNQIITLRERIEKGHKMAAGEWTKLEFSKKFSN